MLLKIPNWMPNQKWKSLIAENNSLEEIKHETSDKLSKSQSTTAALAFPKLS